MLLSNEKTMSSREVAELSGKNHKNIIRDIKNLLLQLNGNPNEYNIAFEKNSIAELDSNFNGLKIEPVKLNEEKAKQLGYSFILSEYPDSKREMRPEYILTKKDVLLLISGYDAILRAKVINRWEELESKTAIDFNDPNTVLKLAQNWAEEQERRLLAEKQIKVLEAKTELMDRVLDSDEKIDIGQAAKILELPFGRNTLFDKLKEKGVFFKNRNEPKQEFIQKGYFQLKEKFIERNNHDGFVVLKVLVTQRGLEFLANLFKVQPESKTLAVIR
jgi:anti-repressor protein